MNAPFNLAKIGKKITICFGPNKFVVYLENPITAGKLIYDKRIIAITGYDPNNIFIHINNKVIDHEELIGAEDQKLTLTTLSHHKGAITLREVKEKLKIMAGCSFHSQGAKHEKWKNKDGKIFTLPRHVGDLGYGLLSKIIKQAGLEMGVSKFLSAK